MRGFLRRKGDAIDQMNARFEKWQKKNPGKRFKDFYAEVVEKQLKQGESHATLGENLKKGRYDESGQGFFERLIKWGLSENDVCVDYGCGTLRVGLHVIRYLKPGSYWGMDIADFLLDEGRKLIGEQLLLERKPNLRVITKTTVAEVAAQRPGFLFATAVLVHVHPNEVPEFASNIMRIIGNWGQAVITAKCSTGDTVQYSGRSWAHGLSSLQAAFLEHGGRIGVLEEEDIVLEKVDAPAKRQIFRITHLDWSDPPVS